MYWQSGHSRKIMLKKSSSVKWRPYKTAYIDSSDKIAKTPKLKKKRSVDACQSGGRLTIYFCFNLSDSPRQFLSESNRNVSESGLRERERESECGREREIVKYLEADKYVFFWYFRLINARFFSNFRFFFNFRKKKLISFKPLSLC
jgi:hypothetical protein